MKQATILTGSNSGDRKYHLTKAIAEIKKNAGKLVNVSSIYESESWGYDDPVNYYNQLIQINTKLSPKELLEVLLNIETKLGRVRAQNNTYTSRTIDLDILFYERDIINTEKLVIPHPKIQFRKFALLPLAEIIPEFVHPILNKSICAILEDCIDSGTVTKIKTKQ